MYKINHIHLKSKDPEADANWFQKAFNFKITSDEVRAVGDRFSHTVKKRSDGSRKYGRCGKKIIVILGSPRI